MFFENFRERAKYSRLVSQVSAEISLCQGGRETPAGFLHLFGRA
jgi:hypothetical protein